MWLNYIIIIIYVLLVLISNSIKNEKKTHYLVFFLLFLHCWAFYKLGNNFWVDSIQSPLRLILISPLPSPFIQSIPLSVRWSWAMMKEADWRFCRLWWVEMDHGENVMAIVEERLRWRRPINGLQRFHLRDESEFQSAGVHLCESINSQVWEKSEKILEDDRYK